MSDVEKIAAVLAPWGSWVAAPYARAWDGIPGLGRCLHREAMHRSYTLTIREVDAALETLQVVEALEMLDHG